MMHLPILSLSRRLLDTDSWINSAFDIFDPFDELDQELCRDLIWLRKPILRERRKKPNVPKKYRLSLDVHGYQPDGLSTEIVDGKLVVKGFDEVTKDQDYKRKEFRKTFELPPNVDEQKMISYITKKGNMIIEVPYIKGGAAAKGVQEKEEPIIQQNPDGSGTVKFSIDASNLDVTKLQVTLKDYDVFINYEEKVQPEESARISDIKRLRLPENTDIQSLKCLYDRDFLTIEAYLLPESKNVKNIPIQFGEQQLEEQVGKESLEKEKPIWTEKEKEKEKPKEKEEKLEKEQLIEKEKPIEEKIKEPEKLIEEQKQPISTKEEKQEEKKPLIERQEEVIEKQPEVQKEEESGFKEEQMESGRQQIGRPEEISGKEQAKSEESRLKEERIESVKPEIGKPETFSKEQGQRTQAFLEEQTPQEKMYTI